VAGDGRHDILWVVDANGLKVRVLPARLPPPLDLICVRQAHYPVTDCSSNTIPPLVAQYHPKRRRSSVAAHVFRRRTEETQEMDTMELDTTVLPVDAMGRLWGMFQAALYACIALIGRSAAVAFVLLEVIRRSKFRIPVEELSSTSTESSREEEREKAWSRWRFRSAPGKSINIGTILLPRRWSL
jgi:hypothetical protein